MWESSGSSGEPGVFVQDAAALAVYDALEALRRPLLRPLQRWLDPWSLRRAHAFIGAIGGHFASTVSVERLRRLNPALAPRLHGVSFLQPTPRLVAELDALAPTVIATYPSAAVLLAEERLAGRLRTAPQEVWTGGETLSPAMRALRRAGLRLPGGQQLRRLGVPRARLRMPRRRPAPEQRLGHPRAGGRARPRRAAPARPAPRRLLTNLANHLQPLIRYDLGDRVTLRAGALRLRLAPCR